jgi:two-component system, LuxR family, response regulator FixJ
MTVRSCDTRAATDAAPTVFIVDDDPVVRAVVARAVASMSLDAVGCADGAAALAIIDGERSGCIVLDLHLPDMTGFDVIKQLRSRDVQLPIIIVTSHADVPTAVQALRAGVFDFFEKPVGGQQLLERVQAAVASDADHRTGWIRLLNFSHRVGRLTQREREVLHLVVAGRSSRSIAETLALSPKTIETHRARVMAKTGVSSLAELIRLGLLVRIEPRLLAVARAAAYGTPPQGGTRR